MLLRTNAAHVPKEVRDEGAGWIRTDRFHEHLDAGQLRLALAKKEGGLVLQVLLHHHRGERVVALLRRQDLSRELLRVNSGQARKLRHHEGKLVVRHIGRHDAGGEDGHIVYELFPVPVEDIAAGGQVRHDAKPVVRRPRLVRVVFEDLHAGQLEDQDAEEEDDQRLQEQESPLGDLGGPRLPEAGAPATAAVGGA